METNKKLNIAFLDASTIGEVESIGKIKSLGNFTSYSLTSPNQRIERIKDQDIIITNKVIIDKETIDACSRLKLICISATGMNNVDLDYAKSKGIQVRNVAGYSTESVAQTTFAMLLFLMQKLNYYDEYVKSGEYCNSPTFTHLGRPYWELKGKQYGIIGLGTIGRRVASIANAFGARVVYYSTSGQNKNSSYSRLEFEELLQTSDVISIHCPLNEKTDNLISLDQLKKMKKSAILINVGRGKIVNENDLAIALNGNYIAAAGIDVLESEPIKKDNPLLNINYPEKLLITPHIAWISNEARTELVEGIYKNIIDWIKHN